MAKLILKAPYYKPGHITEDGKTRGGLADYIATREGVEILRGGMLDYIGERRGSNGLFSDAGTEINLSEIRREIDGHPGNVWGLIISLRREDAERTGYDSAVQWVNLLQSRRNDFAKEMGIAPENFRWYAAYHNKETNPHVHMLVWSKRPQEPFLSRTGIHNIKEFLAADIFRQENLEIYKKQTEVRGDIKEQYRHRISELMTQIRDGNFEIPSELYQNFSQLCEKLYKHKGKKVYGYLDKSAKKLADEIVKTLSEDEKISELYDLWYKCRCETYRNYTDTMPEKIQLWENKEFKSVRNAVVSAAAEIGLLPNQPHKETAEEIKIDNPKRLEIDAELGDIAAMYRLGKYYYDETDDADEAEYWLRTAADNGNAPAMFLIYKGYRDGKFTDKPGDGQKFLRMAADKNYAPAELEFALQVGKEMPNVKLTYLIRAAEHGCASAEYEIGKLYYENGQTEQGLAHLEKSAETDLWVRTRLGLLYFYSIGNPERGMELLNSASDQNYAPATEAVNKIQSGLNAQIFTCLCDLFYYAAEIIDEKAETESENGEHICIDRRQRRENMAKRNGVYLQYD